jgi:hypothetical protein
LQVTDGGQLSSTAALPTGAITNIEIDQEKINNLLAERFGQSHELVTEASVSGVPEAIVSPHIKLSVTLASIPVVQLRVD